MSMYLDLFVCVIDFSTASAVELLIVSCASHERISRGVTSLLSLSIYRISPRSYCILCNVLLPARYSASNVLATTVFILHENHSIGNTP